MPLDDFPKRRTAILTEPQAERIILDRGKTPDAEFAAKFGVADATVANVRLRRSWCGVWDRLIEQGRLSTEADG